VPGDGHPGSFTINTLVLIEFDCFGMAFWAFLYDFDSSSRFRIYVMKILFI
jgi:hypothetical protein